MSRKPLSPFKWSRNFTESIKQTLNLLLIGFEYVIDFVRSLRWSKSSLLCEKQKKLYYDIIMLIHTIEKGLSLQNPTPGFGREKINKIIDLCSSYEADYNPLPFEMTLGAVEEYLEFHKRINFDLGEFEKQLKIFAETLRSKGISPKGGTKTVNINLSTGGLISSEILSQRFSCRQYSSELISIDLIKQVIKIAQQAPSQCNRQSVRAHFYQDPQLVKQLLVLQSGSSGFSDDVRNLFIITSDLSSWSGYKSRSQSYVDASLFAMQLMNACQSIEILTCPLNLACSNFLEFKIQKHASIPSGERLVMMIAAGYPDRTMSTIKKARSERIKIDECLRVH